MDDEVPCVNEINDPIIAHSNAMLNQTGDRVYYVKHRMLRCFVTKGFFTCYFYYLCISITINVKKAFLKPSCVILFFLLFNSFFICVYQK